MCYLVPDSGTVSRAAWKCSSAAAHSCPDLQCLASLSLLCSFQTDVMLLRMTLTHRLNMRSGRHRGLRSLAVGIPASIFGFRQSHFHIYCLGTSVIDHRLQRAVKMVFLTPSGHF